MPFVDTNSLLTNKTYIFDIKCLRAMNKTVFLGPSLGLVTNKYCIVRFFNKRDFSSTDWLDPLLTKIPHTGDTESLNVCG